MKDDDDPQDEAAALVRSALRGGDGNQPKPQYPGSAPLLRRVEENALREALRVYVAAIHGVSLILARDDEHESSLVASYLSFLGDLRPGHAEDELDEAMLLLRAFLEPD